MSALKDLKPGEKCLIAYRVTIGWSSYTNYQEATVDRITKSGLIVVDDLKFYPESGRERSSSRYKTHICTIDDESARKTMEEMKVKIKINKVCTKMNTIKREDLTYDQAVQISKIMGWDE